VGYHFDPAPTSSRGDHHLRKKIDANSTKKLIHTIRGGWVRDPRRERTGEGRVERHASDAREAHRAFVAGLVAVTITLFLAVLARAQCRLSRHCVVRSGSGDLARG